ncbi:MAG: MFS transporter, partial [Acidobacteriota bacterium]|nr:MFS transporter [Acidobacteriota bacterium]
NFRNLLCGQIISEMGNWFNFIAGLGLVRLVSDASPTAAGILFVCRILPFALFSPIAGTFVDRFSRRAVMIWTDLVRVAVALMFLLVTSAEDLWIAYIATALLSIFGAFFDGAKNAATPNMTGKDGLLAGTALMFSTRFLLMAVGSALGGFAAAFFGYKIAFVINAVSFAASAFSVWLIPEEAMRENENYELRITNYETGKPERESFFTELKEGFNYTIKNHFALTILIMNVIWATGGGAINVVFERMGGVFYAEKENLNPDIAVALLWTAGGFGLFFGMMIAHRTSAFLDRRNNHSSFIIWSLIIHGILFAVAGYMPNLWLFAFFTFVSRAIVGVEYAVQETMFQRSLPDYIRGRISTLDRGAELTIFGLSSYLASLSMYQISPQFLTVISGVLSASAGVVWFMRNRNTNLGFKIQDSKLETN